MGDATQAVLQADLALVERVIASHVDIAGDGRSEETAFTLLALQAAVAADLRAVLRGAERYSDRRGCGTHGWARDARSQNRPPPSPARRAEGVSEHFTDMGAVAVALAHGASEVLLSRDPEYRYFLLLCWITDEQIRGN